MERKPVAVGQTVIYCDSQGRNHPALVTAVWSETCINLVFVSNDENRTDSFGRQIERQTSLSHGSQEQVHGFYWRFEDEEPNAYRPPIET